MSRAHIRLRRASLTDSEAIYYAETADFEPPNSEVVAKVVIDRLRRTYELEPLGRWTGEPLVPLGHYELPQSEREQLTARRPEWHSGAWTALIHRGIMRMLNSETYPESELGAV